MQGNGETNEAALAGMSKTDKSIFDALLQECGEAVELWFSPDDPKPWKGRTRVGRGIPRRRLETSESSIESLASWARDRSVKSAKDAEE